LLDEDPTTTSTTSTTYLKDFTLEELGDYCEKELEEPRKRARHVWTHLYGDAYLKSEWEDEGQGNGEDMGFSQRFLSKVGEKRVEPGAGMTLTDSRSASDGTTKLIFQREADGLNIETVLIPVDKEGSKPRVTVCVSSQVGCAMGCKFCYTGLMGLQANLTAGEIVEQVVQAKRMQRGTHLPVTNIVFMGMGEPFHNLDAVLKAIKILTTESKGYTQFSQRKITVSTVGLVPEMRRFAQETDAQLALSLHATTEESRSSIVPTNNKYSLKEVVETLEELFPKGRTKGSHGRHVLIEYVMLEGVNDTTSDAKRLVKLLENVEAKVNLLVFNTFEGSPFVPADMDAVKNFRAHLVSQNLVCTIRDSRGDDKMAACGQLGLGKKKKTGVLGQI